MAKKASTTGGGAAKKKSTGGAARKKPAAGTRSKAPKSKTSQSDAKQQAKIETPSASDALVKLLESPLVIDLLAVGASAALATLAEHRFSRRDRVAATGKTGRAVKAAGTAAASAMGRRLVEEWDEIRRSSDEEAKAGGGS